MRKKVKILQSIAGLGDPSQAVLERKYAQMTAELEGRKKPPSAAAIEAVISAERKKDQQAVRTGFLQDWSFKPDQEVMINAELAEKWEESGICLILGEKKAA